MRQRQRPQLGGRPQDYYEVIAILAVCLKNVGWDVCYVGAENIHVGGVNILR